MPKRQKRVKLSKAQILENDTNKWLAKKDAAIAMLVKAMGKLVELDRATRRTQKRDQQLAEYAKASRKMRVKAVTNIPVTEMPIADVLPEDRDRRMEAMGFRKTGKRKAQPAVTG
jgi:cytidylate kinase